MRPLALALALAACSNPSEPCIKTEPGPGCTLRTFSPAGALTGILHYEVCPPQSTNLLLEGSIEKGYTLTLDPALPGCKKEER